MGGEGSVRLSSRVERITQNNPGVYTGAGTNTHLIGVSAVFVLDPGQGADEHHLEAITRAIGDRSVQGIVVTHAHPDHWSLAPQVAGRHQAPVLGFAARGDFSPDRTLGDLERLEGPDTTLIGLHTPGHASDHLCFLLQEERAVFSGDQVMGWSTSVIAPPDGNLKQFMASLERLLELDVEVLYPAHGPVIRCPHERIRELHTHRQERTRQVLATLADRADTAAGLAARIYTDVDPELLPAARSSVLAHLEALIDDRRVVRQGSEPLEANYRLRT